MTIGSILLGLALLGLVGLFIARPLFKPEHRRTPRTTKHQVLLDQKEVVLIEIKSLDFDHDTGKLPEVEYHQKREQLMVEATAILKQLDAIEGTILEPEAPLETQDSAPKRDRDADIERAVASLRAKPVQEKTLVVEPKPIGGTNGKANFCPQCGQATDPEDKFCANCGHKLLIPQHA